MARYTGPITRISRRLGIMLFANKGSKAKAFKKKPYKPGEHGQKRFGQESEYSKQLKEKQKARFMYGISEKKCKRYFDYASKKDGIAGVEFMKVLERRLDNTIFRAGLAKTRAQARQMASHGIMTLNGKKIKTPSILIKEGDVIAVKETKRGSKLFEEIKKEKTHAPKWLKSDISKLTAEVIALPNKDDIERAINSQLITEYYSR